MTDKGVRLYKASSFTHDANTWEKWQVIWKIWILNSCNGSVFKPHNVCPDLPLLRTGYMHGDEGWMKGSRISG